MDRQRLGQAVFAVNAFAASMLALYLGLRLGLLRPYWAMTTAYIVSQPLSGALRSKALYRAAGTLLGAAGAVLLVPTLANAPVLLSLTLALWVGVCLFVSLLDRTPRSYVLMLAGYTGAIIGFPSVVAPGAIFDVAEARVEEILLGILCATVVHMVVFPRSVASVIAARIDAWMTDARAWTLDMLAGAAPGRRDRDRQRLAADATEVYLLSTHLPFDTSNLRAVTGIVRALQDRMVMLLPLATAVGDRLAALRAQGPLPPAWDRLLSDFAAWLRAGPNTTPHDAERMRRAVAAAPLDGEGWRGLLFENLADCLRQLLDTHQECRELRLAFRQGAHEPPPGLGAAVRARMDRPLHRDAWLAFLSGLAAAVAIALCCAAWIVGAWPEGAFAALTAAVFCSFFATRDDPVPGIVNFMVFTLVSMPVVAVYLFAVLPRVQDFPMLVLVLAPVLLPLGYAIADPRWSPWAMPLTLGVGNGLALTETFRPDFASFLNGNVAQVIGLMASILVTALFRSVGADWSARRLLRAAWRELAALAREGRVIDAGAFVGRMLDRLGQLALRLAIVPANDRLHAADALADLRAGLNIGELNVARPGLDAEASGAVGRLLGGLAAHYEHRRADDPRPPDPRLLPALDSAIAAAQGAKAANPDARRSIIALVSLRRNLFPAAEGFPAAAVGEGA